MKKLKAFIFFAVVCICFLFACSKPEDNGPAKAKEVTVAWDAPLSFEDGTPITEEMELLYNVYIDIDTDETHDDKQQVNEKPISETQYTISLTDHKSIYFVGIETIAYKIKDGERGGDPIKSRTAWSSNESDTKGGTFSIKYE